jgi:Rap1a immunity proteins
MEIVRSRYMKRTALGFLSLAFLYFALVPLGQKVDHATGQAPHPAKNVVVSDIQGTELLRSCNMGFATNGFQFCEAFIEGVRDGVVLATELRNAQPIIGTPAGTKQEQLKDAVLKYLNEHPEEHHKPAAVLVVAALSQAFPPQEKTAR